MKRIAFYGGTFDPVHCGHITVAERLLDLFSLDKFIFLPAYHAPHKAENRPTSAYHRFAMLSLATAGEPNMLVSTLELDHSKKRYTVETLPEIIRLYPGTELFFVMGADSWNDITTWREWENVLTMTNHIVVTRPGYPLGFDHVTAAIQNRIVDLRQMAAERPAAGDGKFRIYVTDAVKCDVSASGIREDVRVDDKLDQRDDVPPEVAKYIEKYELYK
ncbi:MAG TPA: nicotinate-nucleotide adenylyltransferase [Pyrinomonadaceae bacterium]